MKRTKTVKMEPETFDRISWSTRVVRFMDLGEVMMDVDRTRMRFSIRKKGMVTHTFSSLDQFERFAAKTMDYHKAYRTVTATLCPTYASSSRSW